MGILVSGREGGGGGAFGTCAIYLNSFRCTADGGNYLSGLYRKNI